MRGRLLSDLFCKLRSYLFCVLSNRLNKPFLAGSLSADVCRAAARVTVGEEQSKFAWVEG